MPGTGAPATQLNYTVEVGVEHSSNINYSQYDPISQDLLIPRMFFTFDQVGSTVQAHAIGQIEYRDYLQGDFNNEFRGNLAAALNWVVAPQWLTFAVTENSSVEPVNPLANNAPTNVQQTNVFAAGPSLLLHFSDALRGQVDLRYIDTTASKTKYFDSDRGFGALRLVRDLNATDQLSLNAEAQHVHFQQPSLLPGQFTPDYDSYDLYGRYQSKLAHVQVDASLGWSKYTFGQGEPDQSGSLAKVQLNWLVTPQSTFGLGLTREFTDASEQMVIDPTQVGTNIDTTSITVGGAAVTPQIYLEKRIDANYAYQNARFGITLAPYYRQLEYVGDPLYDQQGPGLTLSFQYKFTPLLTGGFAAAGEHTSYTTLDRRDEFYSYGPFVTEQLTPHWSWQLNLTRNRRDSDSPGLSYAENLVFFTLSYKR
ncbi:MAG: hypothetical protein JSS21_00695 [Proteobacteria bacterium]|nr:hypothetical protein [Pseudomonadota bacterium]